MAVCPRRRGVTSTHSRRVFELIWSSHGLVHVENLGLLAISGRVHFKSGRLFSLMFAEWNDAHTADVDDLRKGIADYLRCAVGWPKLLLCLIYEQM